MNLLEGFHVEDRQHDYGGKFVYKIHRDVLDTPPNVINRATPYDWDIFKLHPLNNEVNFYRSLIALIISKVPENVFPDEYSYTRRKLNDGVKNGLLVKKDFDGEFLHSNLIAVPQSMNYYYNQAITGTVLVDSLALYIPTAVWYKFGDAAFCSSIYDHYLLLNVKGYSLLS